MPEHLHSADFQVSVVIPVYNRKEYLQEAIESILNQTHPASEIIVVNDGSTDDTYKVIEFYSDKLTVINIENSGCGNARRVGAEATKYSWLAFCDSDDLWMPEHLERRLRLLQKYPETNFSFSDMAPFGSHAHDHQTYFSDAPKSWWEKLGLADHEGYLPITNTPYRNFLAFNPVGTPTIVMTKELYNSVGGINAKYSRMQAEDADLTRKAIANGKTCCDMTVTAKQRRHGENMSTVEAENLLGKAKILEDHINEKICPNKELKHVKQAILITKNLAVQAAYYKRNFYLSKILSRNIRLRDLNFKVKLQFLLIKLYGFFGN
jgi:glycosyltransferase involved in cell wall biosynthesis